MSRHDSFWFSKGSQCALCWSQKNTLRWSHGHENWWKARSNDTLHVHLPLNDVQFLWLGDSGCWNATRNPEILHSANKVCKRKFRKRGTSRGFSLYHVNRDTRNSTPVANQTQFKWVPPNADMKPRSKQQWKKMAAVDRVISTYLQNVKRSCLQLN